MPLGPNSRAIDSAKMRCAAFVDAKKPQWALPRVAEVLPVTMTPSRTRSVTAAAADRSV